MIDWQVVATIAAPIVALFFGVWVNRRFESRPILVSYYGHVSAFTHHPAQGQPINVHTHAIVLRNAGRRTATNVRIGHNVLPDFNIWPQLNYSVGSLPGGGQEIIIPTLVPGEEITVSYLYFPPLTVAGINTGIKSDQGFARPITVLLQRQYPKWFNASAAFLILIGLVAVLYLAFRTLIWALR